MSRKEEELTTADAVEMEAVVAVPEYLWHVRLLQDELEWERQALKQFQTKGVVTGPIRLVEVVPRDDSRWRDLGELTKYMPRMVGLKYKADVVPHPEPSDSGKWVFQIRITAPDGKVVTYKSIDGPEYMDASRVEYHLNKGTQALVKELKAKGYLNG